jgi:hypothetical protein
MKTILAAGVAALALAFGAGAQASNVVHVDVSGTFNDGGTVSGWYNFNTATQTSAKWDVVTTAGSALPGDTYKNGGIANLSIVNATQVDFFRYHSLNDFDGIVFVSNHLQPQVAAEAHFPCFEDCTYDAIRFGLVSYSATVPEPGVWALMIVGLGLVGSALRRRSIAALA